MKSANGKPRARSSRLLLDEAPLIIQPSLACAVGLNEALVLQQVNYWLNMDHIGETRDGRKWVKITRSQWIEQLPFFGRDTINRTIARIREIGVLLAEQSAGTWDRAMWFSIDYDVLNDLDELEASAKQARRAASNRRSTHHAALSESQAMHGLKVRQSIDAMSANPSAESQHMINMETTSETTSEIFAAAVSGKPFTEPLAPPATPTGEPESVRSDGVPALNETPNVPPAPPVEPTKPKRARSIQQRALVCECGAAMTGTRAELQAAGWRWKGPLGKGEPREAMCPACHEKKLHPGKMMDAFFEPLKRPQAAGAMPPPEFDMACIARLMQRYIDSGITREQMNEAGWIFGAWWVVQNVKPVLIWTEAQANYVIKGAIQMVRAGHDRYSFAEWMQAEVGKPFWMGKSISFDYAMKNVGMRRREVAA